MLRGRALTGRDGCVFWRDMQVGSRAQSPAALSASSTAGQSPATAATSSPMPTWR